MTGISLKLSPEDKKMSVSSTNAIFNIINYLLKQNVFINVLEIGTADGLTTKEILSLLKNKGKLYCCDPFISYDDKPNRDNNETFNRFLNNVKNISNENNFYFKKEKSEIFLNELVSRNLKKCFDIIFIDGDHSTNAVINDFKLSNLLIKDTGIIIFDDYTWIARHLRHDKNEKPPVYTAVKQIMNENKDYKTYASNNDSYVIQKKERKK